MDSSNIHMRLQHNLEIKSEGGSTSFELVTPKHTIY